MYLLRCGLCNVIDWSKHVSWGAHNAGKVQGLHGLQCLVTLFVLSLLSTALFWTALFEVGLTGNVPCGAVLFHAGQCLGCLSALQPLNLIWILRTLSVHCDEGGGDVPL